jgi:hypothetical protein
VVPVFIFGRSAKLLFVSLIAERQAVGNPPVQSTLDTAYSLPIF